MKTTEHSELIGTTDIVIAGGKGYWLYECDGCHHVQLGRSPWCSEEDPQVWTKTIQWLPRRAVREPPTWLEELPEEYRAVLTETYAAINTGLLSLPMMGVRTAIALFIRLNVGDSNFRTGLKRLKQNGMLSEKQFENLDPVVDAGSAAAHRGFVPTEDQLMTAVDVLENLLRNQVLAASVSELSKSTPKK